VHEVTVTCDGQSRTARFVVAARHHNKQQESQPHKQQGKHQDSAQEKNQEKSRPSLQPLQEKRQEDRQDHDLRALRQLRIIIRKLTVDDLVIFHRITPGKRRYVNKMQDQFRAFDVAQKAVGTAIDGRLQPRFPHLHVTDYVFDHDDGVIHDETGRNSESHEGEVIEAVAKQIHDAESADKGERNGDAGNDGGAEAAQEKKDHHHHQADCEHQFELDVLDRSADGSGAVGENRDIDGGRKAGLQLRQKFLDAVNDADNIRAGLALDVHQDGRLLIGPSSLQDVLDSVGHGSHIGDTNGSTVAIGDDDGAIGVGTQKLVVCADGVGLLRPVKSALGLIDVGAV